MAHYIFLYVEILAHLFWFLFLAWKFSNFACRKKVDAFKKHTIYEAERVLSVFIHAIVEWCSSNKYVSWRQEKYLVYLEYGILKILETFYLSRITVAFNYRIFSIWLVEILYIP